LNFTACGIMSEEALNRGESCHDVFTILRLNHLYQEQCCLRWWCFIFSL